jgi:hypothetical protein
MRWLNHATMLIAVRSWGAAPLLDYGINDTPSIWIAKQCFSNLT